MKIEPNGAGSTSPNAARQLDRKPAAQPAQPEGRPQAPAEPPVDRAVISETARDLGEQRKAVSDPGARLPADTLRVIVQRACSGFYDQPEIREIVLSRLAADLETGPAE